jgi:hypothetical protein
MHAIKFKPHSLRNVLWIKYFFPMFIIKPGTSYVPLYHTDKNEGTGYRQQMQFQYAAAYQNNEQ